MSKKEPNIVINNHINNENTNINNNGNDKSKPNSSLQKFATIVSIVAGLIAIYMFFSENINNSFNSNYDSTVKQLIED